MGKYTFEDRSCTNTALPFLTHVEKNLIFRGREGSRPVQTLG